MKLTDEKIAEVADLLESGMICFVHRTTGRIAFHPDEDDLYFDPEPWQDVIDKIENDEDHYVRLEKMDSQRGFRVMEGFAHSLSDTHFRYKLLDQLSRRHPFQHFKRLIDASDYRQDWFAFKKKAYLDWVKWQLDQTAT